MAAPRVSVSEITTVGASFADDLAAYAGAGASGIGIWELKLGDEDAAALAALRESGLRATNCVPVVPSILPLPLMEGPAEPEERVEAICDSLRRLARFEPTACLCLTGPPGERDPADARAVAVEGLRRVADEARSLGLRLGVEPVHERFRELWTLVSSIPETVELLDEVGRPELGIMVDTWHLWSTPTLLDDVARERDRIVGVHVADWREPTRNTNDRVFPGDGVAGLPRILDSLHAAGWDGWYDVEIFSDASLPDSLWALDVREAARLAVDSLLGVWDARTP